MNFKKTSVEIATELLTQAIEIKVSYKVNLTRLIDLGLTTILNDPELLDFAAEQAEESCKNGQEVHGITLDYLLIRLLDPMISLRKDFNLKSIINTALYVGIVEFGILSSQDS